MAGERFAVRNSGACAVVEGVGDHGCEYMTGGRVVVLGPTGKNFAAGMSGGIAYVWDEDRDLYLRLNKALVTVDPVTERQDIQEIRTMLTEHVEATGSPKAREILEHLEEKAACFKKILPRWRHSVPAPRNKGEKVLWERSLDFWNMTGRLIRRSSHWTASSIGRSSTPACPRRTAASRGPGAWSAVCPSASPAPPWAG